jgi:hypothetical protein
MKELAYLFNKLKDPEYVYLLIENFIIWGLAIGIIAAAIAFFCKERKTQGAALVLVILAAVMVVPYNNLREEADKRKGYFFPTKKALIVKQNERWMKAQWVFFAVAGLAGATLLMGAHNGRPGLITGVVTILAGISCVFFTIWLNLKEAEIYHPNLRDGPRITSQTEKKVDKAIEDVRSEARKALSYRPAE